MIRSIPHRIMRVVLCACLCPLLAHPADPGQPPSSGDALPPISAFFANDSHEIFRISPGGKHVAYLAFDGKSNALHAGDPENPGNSTIPLTNQDHGNIVSFLWLDDSTLAFTAASGNVTRVGTARLPDAQSAAKGPITKFLTSVTETPVLTGVTTTGHPARPRVLVSLPTPGHPGFMDIHALNPDDDTRTMLHRNLEGVSVWNTSADGTLLAGIRCHPDGSSELLVLQGGTSLALLHCAPGESLNLSGIAPDNQFLFIISNHGQTTRRTRLESVSMATGACTVLAEDPTGRVDFGEPVFDRPGGNLLGARYFREKSAYTWHTVEMSTLFASLRDMLPDGDIAMQESSLDGKNWLVSLTRDCEPTAEYFFNTESNRLTRLDTRRHTIPPASLGRMLPVHYLARDNQVIPAYLTMPPGNLESMLPVVVFPHGGPNMRTFWGYDPRVQFLASRGYAVFQPNFRGSSGYGKAFQDAGNRQWGRGIMQDDISDGVAWLVAEGIADPRRIAIMGGSYGGFAALAGTAFTPDLYAAGICLFGASNLPDFLRDIPPRWKPFLGDLALKIGNPEQPDDARRLAWQSPISAVAAIRAPLLVYHGAKDDLIRLSQADRFVAACRTNHVAVDYLVSPDEGHGFSDPLTEQAVYLAIEKFLASHLGGCHHPDLPAPLAARLDALRASARPSTASHQPADKKFQP